MGMFFGQPCPLCGVKMTGDDRLFGTTHFLGEDSDLWRFSDAVLHWDCYASWEHRPRFARLYFEALKGVNEYWPIAHEDDDVRVSLNRDRLIRLVRVELTATGSSLEVHVDDWEDWLDADWSGHCRHQVERDALMAVLPRLISALPTGRVSIGRASSLAGRRTRSSMRGRRWGCYQATISTPSTRTGQSPGNAAWGHLGD